MNTTLKLATKRSKSEVPHSHNQSLDTFKTKLSTKNANLTNIDNAFLNNNKQAQRKQNDNDRKCHCCNKNKYHDYLPELRRQRLERMQKKAIAQAFMQSPIPLIQSTHLQQEQPTEFSLQEQNNFISRLSNKQSEYEQTPRKSILQSFHDSIIKSHTRNYMPLGFKNEGNGDKSKGSGGSGGSGGNSRKFLFQIRVDDGGKVGFARSFSAAEFGEQAIKIIQQILQRNSDDNS